MYKPRKNFALLELNSVTYYSAGSGFLSLVSWGCFVTNDTLVRGGVRTINVTQAQPQHGGVRGAQRDRDLTSGFQTTVEPFNVCWSVQGIVRGFDHHFHLLVFPLTVYFYRSHDAKMCFSRGSRFTADISHISVRQFWRNPEIHVVGLGSDYKVYNSIYKSLNCCTEGNSAYMWINY